MGKSGYKRFKKQEKAKVKLKGNKTLLPKGQNVTDTSFKVKKIIVKEQLKQYGEQEQLTNRYLNIKELISRANHHNVSMRQEAASSLRGMVSTHGRDIVLANFSSLLQAAMSLTIDKESEVRTETLKLLATIFDKVTEEELSPLFQVIVCHLTCAMTHIEPGVRADSLRLLDTLLATLPSLTAAHTPTLLPHFLDLISQRPGDSDGTGRTLSLHLDGRVTSEKWRNRVIGRLNKLFHVIWDHSKKVQDGKRRDVKWAAGQRTYLGLYSPLVTGVKQTDDISNLPMKDYAEMLLPLLLDTCIEAVPQKMHQETDMACVIGVDTAALLQNIVEIILHIWKLLELSPQQEHLTEWFKSKWSDLVVNRLVQGRFPYSVSAATSRKRQRDTEHMLAALQMSSNPSCSLLNLQLCLINFLLAGTGPLWTQSVQYIKRSLRNGGPLKPEEVNVLCQCLEASCNQPVPVGCASLLGVLTGYILNNLDKPANRRALDFVTSIALKPFHYLHQDKNFTTWLDYLPALLCKPSLPLSVVKSIASIATRGLPAFTNSLDGWIEAILGNLPQVTEDEDQEGLRLIVSLVYWVTDWDEELQETIRELIQQGSLGPLLTAHLVDIIRLKIDSTELEEMKTKFEEMLPVLSDSDIISMYL